MSNNKVTTYLLYAIGEIFLVVVGILIAVSLNNLNQQRQQRMVELSYLSNLKTDLIRELTNNQYFMDFRKAKVKSASYLLHTHLPATIEEAKTFTENYEQIFFWDEFVPTNNTFKELLSSGNLNLIQNDSIKEGLLELNKQYALISNVEHHMRREFEKYLYDIMIFNASALEFYDTRSVQDTLRLLGINDLPADRQKKLIEDTQWLFKDETFRNGLKLAFMNNTALGPVHKELEQSIQMLIKLIDNERNK